VVAIYSTFLQRAYDNILHDVALQGLPVCFCIDRAGLNPADGPTHHGIYDVAFLSQIPNVKVYTPATYEGLAASLKAAVESEAPCAVRYPRGGECAEINQAFYSENREEIGVVSDFESGAVDAVVVTYGRITAEALKAKKSLAQKGIKVGIILLEFLKPYEECARLVDGAVGTKTCPIIFLEEGIKNGGAGMILADTLSSAYGYDKAKMRLLAIDDDFGYGKKNENIYTTLGISSEDVEREIKELVKEGK
jgi:1-deoxy-D-xylulose-5-phosphate synthase